MRVQVTVELFLPDHELQKGVNPVLFRKTVDVEEVGTTLRQFAATYERALAAEPPDEPS